MGKTELNVFFSLLKEKKKSFEENYQYFAPQLAPKFNSFNYIRPNENGLSEIITDLINPNGLHEQGAVFLEEFLKVLGRNEVFSNYEKQDFKIACESQTNLIEASKRRIDIEINFGRRFGIGIENKPHTWEQNDQLNDYANQLEAKFPTTGSDKDAAPGNWILVYILGYDADPKSISKNRLDKLKVAGKFIQISYSEITEWLKHCKEKCRSDKIRVFIQDFIGHCEQRFLDVTNNAEDNKLELLLSDNIDYFEIAMDISKVIPKVQNLLHYEFANEVYNILHKENEDWQFLIAKNMAFFGGRNIPNGVFFKRENWKNYKMGFEPYASNEMYWGLAKLDSSSKRLLKSQIDSIKSSLSEPFKSTDWWPLWSWLPEEIRYWKNNNTWLNIKIKRHEFARIIADKILTLDNAIRDLEVDL